MDDCIFCKIVKGEIQTDFLKETDNFVVFKDIHPSAPIHLLIVPKRHILDVTECSDEEWMEVRNIAVTLSKEQNTTGFRISTNAGEAAAVKHWHVHFLGNIDESRKL